MLSVARFENVVTRTRLGASTTRRSSSPATRRARASVLPQPAGATTSMSSSGASRISSCLSVGLTMSWLGDLIEQFADARDRRGVYGSEQRQDRHGRKHLVLLPAAELFEIST